VIFGSISYLNLLPFQIFLKRYIKNSSTKMALNYRKNVPAEINRALKRGDISAGFISSIESSKYSCSNLGIVADGAVHSVFVIDGDNKIDIESATSNILAKVLNLRGEVIIGDKALKYHLDGGGGIDLAEEWKRRKNLPFVFARLCFRCHKKLILDIESRFLRQPIKIPQYILKREANRRGITPEDIRWYLQFINYRVDYRAKKSLKLFLKISR